MSILGSLGSFFKSVGKIAPAILQFTPLAPIAADVAAAIQEAEAISGPGTGAEKLAHVIAVATDAAKIANDAAGKQVVDPAVIASTAAQVISAIISVVNVVKPAA